MITIDDVAEHLEQFHQYDGHGWCLCPFHPDTRPSCSVGAHGFKCWSSSCGEKGSLEKLYQKVTGKIVFHEKVYNPSAWIWKNWADKFGSIQTIAKFAHNNLVSNPENGNYLVKRQIDSQIKKGLFGYLEGYYIFPIKNEYEEVVGLTARASPTIQTKKNRYSVTHDCPVKIYTPNWRRLNKEENAIHLCYGTLDVWTLEMIELAGVTGLSGQEFKAEYLDKWRKPIYIIPDKGEEKKAIDLQCSLGWRGMVLKLDWSDGCKDLNEVQVRHGLDTVSKLIEEAKRRYNYESA